MGMNIYSERLEFYGRLLVRDILEKISKFGLVEDQHLYICFNMYCDGLVIPTSLSAQNKDQNLVIVIKDKEYEDLTLDNQGFSIKLFLGTEMPDIVYITYSSLVSFADPSQDFALEFTPTHDPQDLSFDFSQETKVEPVNDNLILFPVKCSSI